MEDNVVGIVNFINARGCDSLAPQGHIRVSEIEDWIEDNTAADSNSL